MSHSTDDFDKSASFWSLDASQYVSTPTSLKMLRQSNNQIGVMLLKQSVSGVMPQGRIVSWWRTPYLNNLRLQCFVFRNKSADGGATTFPFYAVCFTQMQWYWRKYTAGDTYTLIGNCPVPSPFQFLASTWYQLRVSWWNGHNLQNQPATVMRLEGLKDGVWYAAPDLYDTEQLNKDEANCRCGIGYHGHETGVYCWADDTEFWKPIETG